jgi:hypothetical protein
MNAFPDKMLSPKFVLYVILIDTAILNCVAEEL